jgi:hypothetical protein
MNGDNLNNISRKTSRHFGSKKRAYLKDKTDELATNIRKRILKTYIEE